MLRLLPLRDLNKERPQTNHLHDLLTKRSRQTLLRTSLYYPIIKPTREELRKCARYTGVCTIHALLGHGILGSCRIRVTAAEKMSRTMTLRLFTHLSARGPVPDVIQKRIEDADGDDTFPARSDWTS